MPTMDRKLDFILQRWQKFESGENDGLDRISAATIISYLILQLPNWNPTRYTVDGLTYAYLGNNSRIATRNMHNAAHMTCDHSGSSASISTLSPG